MQCLELSKKESGKIWHRKPSPSSDNGLMLQISHSKSSLLGPPGHKIRFLQVAFDSNGDQFISGDHQGNIYLFDLSRNRFQLVQRIGISSTALAFTLRRKTEFLVGLADCSLKCYDIASGEMVAWMKGHVSPIHSISVHASGRYALTTSSDTALLWDLDTFTRRRKLNVKENVGISKVFFLPLSNTIITCFRDDSIFAWESDTLQCKYQLPAPTGPNPGYKSFSTPRDGRLLAAGGRSRFLHIWSLDTRSLLRVVEMPSKVRAVKQVEFLPENFDGGTSQIVGLLSQDGIMRFVHIHECKLLFDIGSLDDRIQTAAISPTGRHIVATTESGSLHVFSVQALMSDFSKPPAPLVKAVDGVKGIPVKSQTFSSASFRGREEVGHGQKERRDKKMARQTFYINTEGGVHGEGEAEEEVFSSLPEGMDLKRLQSILSGYGEYPTKYRMFIWRSILRLPENHSAFSSLIDKGTHIAWAKLHEDYPIKSRRLLRVLQRTLSALAHWSAIFGETEYLPMLAFPFVKLFQNNQLVCFEVIATVLANWCQHWFEFFPNPPINVLSMVENILAFHDKRLLQHFVQYNTSSQIYAWPLLQTLMSEVVTKEEWLKLWDNMFSQHPSYFLFIIVAYLMSARQPLLQCSDIDDFKYFFHHRNAVNIAVVIKEAYTLQETTPTDIHPRKLMEDFHPLTKGQYPIFNKYPKFIVDYQAQERDRIRRDELDYLHQRQAAAELEKELEKRRQEEEAWYRQQQLLREAEEERRRLIAEEEQKVADQKIRLQALRRELRMKELQLLDAARYRFMQNQKQQKEAELVRIDDEIARKAQLRDQETQAALDDVEIRRMELQAQKQSLQQELAREAAAADYQGLAEEDARQKESEIREKALQRTRERQKNRLHEERKELQKEIAYADLSQSQSEYKKQREYRRRLDDLEVELRNIELDELNGNNQALERQINTVMQGIAQAKWVFHLHHQRDNASKVEDEFRDLRAMASHSRHQNNNQLETVSRSSMESPFQEFPSHKGELNGIQTPDSNNFFEFNLDRGRRTFERKEQDLMQEVREIRQKIAKNAAGDYPPHQYNAENEEDDVRADNDER